MDLWRLKKQLRYRYHLRCSAEGETVDPGHDQQYVIITP